MKGPQARWLALGEVPPDLERPAVWLVRNDDPAWAAMVAGVAPNAADLADAALFRNPARSESRLARRMLLKAVAARAIGAAGSDVVVQRLPGGALRLMAPESLYASVSTSAGWTMLALARVAIGVDVEPSEAADPLPMAVLTDFEARWLSGFGDVQRRLAFSRLWTVKEAVLKALDVGLTRNPATLAVRFGADLAEIDLGGGAFAVAEVRTQCSVTAATALLKPSR